MVLQDGNVVITLICTYFTNYEKLNEDVNQRNADDTDQNRCDEADNQRFETNLLDFSHIRFQTDAHHDHDDEKFR